MDKPALNLAILAVLTAGIAIGTPARAQLAEVGEPFTVALPEDSESALFSNNSAAAITEEGNIGIAYTVRDEVDIQRLDVFAPGESVQRYEAPPLSFTWRNTPVVSARPLTTFVFTRFTDVEGGMPELATDLVAFEDSTSTRARSKALQTVENAVRLELREEFDCIPLVITYTPPGKVSLDTGILAAQGFFVPSGELSVGDVYYVHCTDGRSFSVHPDWSNYPEVDFLVLPLSDAAMGKTNHGDVPPARLPVIAGGQNSRGPFIAYMGQPHSGNATALVTVVQQDSDLNITDVFQLDQRPPSLFPGPTLAACGHPDRDHYWVAFTDDQGQAVAARVEGDDVDFIELGDSQAPADVACDGWGNAVVSWLGANANFDYFIRTRVLNSNGTVIAEHDQPLPPEQFPQPQFAVVSNDINEAGDIVAAWSNGGFGVFFRRLKLSGHFRIDGTLSGSHFNSAFDGEGFIFDIVEIDGTPTMVIYYFTYNDDGSGDPTWLVGSGPIKDNRVVAEMITGTGATFGGDFDPGEVERKPAGIVTATFLSCGSVLVQADSNRFGQQVYIAGPLTGLPLAVAGQCGTGPEGTAQVDASRGGSLFAPSRDGEGFIFDIVEINGQPILVAYYFTYQPDGSGKAGWLVGSGIIEGNSATVTMTLAEGATFGLDFDPADVERTEWGEITVTWLTCDNVLIEYDGLWGTGSFNVGRLTPVAIGATGVCAP